MEIIYHHKIRIEEGVTTLIVKKRGKVVSTTTKRIPKVLSPSQFREIECYVLSDGYLVPTWDVISKDV